jgi:hypothetical protein
VTDPTTPSGDAPPASAPLSTAPAASTAPTASIKEPPDPARRRQLQLIGAGIGVAVVLNLMACAGFGALALGIGRLVREAGQTRQAHARRDVACLELEQRLNRLVPPGAATTPARRAAAIRDENVAVQPFLSEIDQLPGWHGMRDGDDGNSGEPTGWTDSWHRLVDARAAYADALDRQVSNGQPAFFLAPKDQRGRPVLDELRREPQSCVGVERRLSAPDL